MELTTIDEDKDKPIYSCPNCESEDIDLGQPVCNECGTDDTEYPKAVEWIQCPQCEKREITVHGVPQGKPADFRLTCSSCDYTAKLGLK